MNCYSQGSRERRFFTGALFLGFGLLLLLDNLDFLDMRGILARWWPLILVGFGVQQLMLLRGSAALIGGLFWIGTGGLFLAGTLGYIELAITRVIWPLMLIWFGVLIALGGTAACGTDRIDDGSKS